jgi:hypothetical protein
MNQMSKLASSFEVPIALFLFNRPKELQQVLNVIASIAPSTLFLIADGPRSNHLNDQSLCQEARSIAAQVDWPCEVHRLYFNDNQTSRNAIPLGLNWVFSKVDQCIILEDDCVPNQSFFNFCAQLLERYKDNPQIMTIGGHRFDGPDESNEESYFFSKYPSTWGWATWKRSWNLFDLEMHQWSSLRETDWLHNILKNSTHESYWMRIFDQMKTGMDAWDYALVFSCWVNQGLSIRSKVNLVHNIGHNALATHTTSENYLITNRLASEINLPLRHPSQIHPNPIIEERLEWVSYSGIMRRNLKLAHSEIQSRKPSKS